MNKIDVDANYVFTFGKHKGKNIKKVLKNDPQYILWVNKNIKELSIHKIIVDIAEDYTSEIDYYDAYDELCPADIEY